MRADLTPDESLLQRLPLPLAQLYRRAHNAKTALERYLTAFYLWEAGLKLLASVAVVEYAERGTADPALAERLTSLARPALGHWWEFARRLLPPLAEGGEPFGRLRDLLLGRARDDLPRAAGLDAVLREVLQGKEGPRATVRLTELFDRLVRLRNEDIGHGAAGQRQPSFYERAGPALLVGLSEVFAHLDVLAGRRLVHVADVRRLASGAWLVERYGLTGEVVRRLESLEVPEAEPARLPRPGRLYLHDGGAAWRCLHPLLLYDADGDRVFFLNSRRGQRTADYLCYTTGEVVRRDELGQEQRELLAHVLGGPVDEAAVAAWAERSRAGEPAESPAPGPTGRTVGEFELLSRIGRGGMGVVYRAWQPSLGRQVALKCLLRSGDPKAEARFRREIRALGKVEHPNLVKVFTSGSDGDQWFYAMELIEGADLGTVCTRLAGSTAAEVGEDDWTTAVSSAWQEQRRQEQPLSDGAAEGGEASGPAAPTATAAAARPALAGGRRAGRGHVARAVEVVRQAAGAAHALHEAGVIHRDLKPGNILLSPDGGHAVLTDLGLAKLAEEVEGRSALTTQFVGTLRYASPEQLGVAGLDRRADVYSLGATLWELLTFRPFLGITDQTATPDTILKVQQASPEPPHRFNPQVPADLEAVVLKCLAKERERRYATAADLAADLGRWQRGEPVLAQPPSLRYLLGKFVRRHRVPLGAAAAVLLAAVVGVAAAFWQISAAYQNEKEAKQQAQDRERDAKEALAKLEARQSQLARSFCEVSDREFGGGNVRDSLNWMLRAYEVAPKGDPLRASYRRLLAGQSLSLGRLLYHGGPLTTVAFSPDGRLALTGSQYHGARLWETATGKPVGPPLGHEGGAWAVAFSPDGRLALTGMNNTARLWEAATGRPVGPPLRHGDSVWTAAFSPDGRLVLTGSSDNTARLWEAATGKLVATLRHFQGVHAVAFSPDGRLALTGGDDNAAMLWEAATGKPVRTLRHDRGVTLVAFSPDGRLVLTGSDNTARLWEAATGKPVATLSHGGPVWALAFSPDGRLALTGSTDHTARLWWTASGRLIGQLVHEDAVAAVAFSPDGRLALTGGYDRKARLWELATRRPVATLPHEGRVHAVAFSSDGRLALTGSADNTARVWEVAASWPVGQALQRGNYVNAVAFSRDGRLALVGSADETARVWEVATRQPAGPPLRHGSNVTAVAFSPDGRLALTGGAYWDGRSKYRGEARLWEVATGKPVGPPLRHEGSVWAVAFSPDGRLALSGGGYKDRRGEDRGEARLWQVPTGKPVGPPLPHEHTVRLVAFSPDGRLVLTGGDDHTTRRWEVATGRPVGHPLRHEGMVNAVAFSPDGRRILTGSWDDSPRVWKAATGKLVATLRQKGGVHAAAFSRDGRLILTGGIDTARLWEAATGQPVGPPLSHKVSISALAFSPDGRLALTGGGREDRGEARLWDIVPPAPDEPARLAAWVHVRTHKAFNDQGILEELSQQVWLGAWQELDARGGDWEPPPDARRWHLTQAADAEAANDWFAAAFHLERLLRLDPQHGELRRRLAAARAHLHK